MQMAVARWMSPSWFRQPRVGEGRWRGISEGRCTTEVIACSCLGVVEKNRATLQPVFEEFNLWDAHSCQIVARIIENLKKVAPNDSTHGISGGWKTTLVDGLNLFG